MSERSSVPKILMLHRQPTAVGYYRSRVQARAIEQAGWEVIIPDEPYYRLKSQNSGNEHPEWAYKLWDLMAEQKPDILHVDREIAHQGLGYFLGARDSVPGCRMIVDFDDDFTAVPRWNPAYKRYVPGTEARDAGELHLELAEYRTVSTATLAKKFDATCVPNVLDPADWVDKPVNPERASDPHLRIFYGGASGHYGDLDAVQPSLEKFLHNPPTPIRLICFGTVPKWIHEVGRRYPGRVVVLPWHSFDHYADSVAWGGFDLAIAPLAECAFNDAKSNIKALEAGIQGIPFVCSRTGPYSDIPTGCAVRLANDEWGDGLEALTTDPGFREQLRSRAKQWVMDEWIVGRNKDLWYNVLQEAKSKPLVSESLSRDEPSPEEKVERNASPIVVTE